MKHSADNRSKRPIPKKSNRALPIGIVKAKPRNTMPSTEATISAERNGSTGSKRETYNADAILLRTLKPMPVVASARTLTRKSRDRSYWAWAEVMGTRIEVSGTAPIISSGKRPQPRWDSGEKHFRLLTSAATALAPVLELLPHSEAAAGIAPR